MSMIGLKLRDAAERFGDAKLACERMEAAPRSIEAREAARACDKAHSDLLSAARAFATSTRKQRSA